MIWSHVHLRVLSHAICIAYIIYNLFTVDEQFLSSNDFAEKFQTFGKDSFIHYFFLIITEIGFPGTLGIVAVVAIFHPKKRLSFRVVFFYALIGFIVGVSKMWYGYQRPWFVDNDIIVYKCSSTDFGRPSGHAFCSLFSVLLLYHKYIYEPTFQARNSEPNTRSSTDGSLPTLSVIIHEEGNTKSIESAQSTLKAKLWSAVILVLLLIFLFLVGLSRVYLGDHSTDQVLLGWAFGMICFVECIYFCDEQLDRFIEFLVTKTWKTKNWFVPFMVLGYLLTLAIPAILEVKNNDQGTFKPEWLANIQRRCPDSSPESEIVNKSFYLCITGVCCFGLIIGLMFAPNDIFEHEPFEWTKRYVGKKLIAGAILAVVGAALYFGIGSLDPWVVFMIKYNLLCLVLPILAFIVIPGIWKYIPGLKPEVKVCDSAQLSMEMTDSQIIRPAVPEIQ